MNHPTHCSDIEFDAWLAAVPTEDELRDTYVALEARRTDLWTTGHIDSFRRDRYERDARYVARLVRVKRALALRWEATGQLDDPRSQPIPA
jgi:hypothetical protein